MRHAFTKLSKNRLFVSIKRRGAKRVFTPLQAHFKYLKSVRSGSKFSRFFRHIFEHKHAKRILGSNLAAFALLTSTTSASPSLLSLNEAETIILSAPEDQLSTTVAIRTPLDEEMINQGYSYYHPGVDYDGVTGDPVYPFMDGIIENVQYSGYDYGNAILVDHENGYKSLYAHLSRILVGQGEDVDIFTKIGEVGSTGRSTGDHLHFEIYKEGRVINPLYVLE